ncbi:MAG TPA: cation:proton antiporter subunit C [Isosphaeraceae bacterium]|jgi:multicomponent Na+:H+ antiporter subunit C|nr:cation:proton antiporter subunit C [Isosphaeraceae bacterium]
MSSLPFAVAAWLLIVGLYGVVTSRNLIHMIICLTVVQSSTYVLLLAIGYRDGALPPIALEGSKGALRVDPIVQALVLTDIVVGATVTALLLALAVKVHHQKGTLDPEELRPMRG